MRSKEEIRGLVEGFSEKRADTARVLREARHGDHELGLLAACKRQRKPKLVRVAVEQAQAPAGFALVLANGRRVESSWGFVAADLEKLVRVAEG